MLKLMAISGSLRKTSYNSAALESIKVLAPAGVDIRIYDALANLPLFNPDHESDAGPEVEKLSMLLGRSDGLIIASPEYAHGISGALKNALDWLVGSEAFINIPVMIINTSPRASHAIESLREVVKTMSGHIIESACVSVPLLGSNLDTIGILKNKKISSQLKSSLAEFHSNIKQ